jgi:hypothetical protein
LNSIHLSLIHEAIVLDKWFTGFVPEQPKGEWLIVSKRPNDRHLSKEEKKRSKQINLVQHSIEKELGDLSSRFTTSLSSITRDMKESGSHLCFILVLHFTI